MSTQQTKLLKKTIPYVVGILCACIFMIFIAGCIAVVDTSVVKLWSYRETVRTATIRYNDYLKREDCVLVERLPSINDAKFKCGDKIIHVWIP